MAKFYYRVRHYLTGWVTNWSEYNDTLPYIGQWMHLGGNSITPHHGVIFKAGDIDVTISGYCASAPANGFVTEPHNITLRAGSPTEYTFAEIVPQSGFISLQINIAAGIPFKGNALVHSGPVIIHNNSVVVYKNKTP